MKLLLTAEHVLVRPPCWDDPFENFFLGAEFLTELGEKVSVAGLRDRWYGQCWTFKRDSDAMWRIYSPDKCGIRIQTTVGKLFSSYYATSDKFAALKYFMGAVEYRPREGIEEFVQKTTFEELAFGGNNLGFANTLLLKRSEFDHENEMRLLFYDAEGQFRGVDLLKIQCRNTDWIEEIGIDPRLDAQSFEAVAQEIRKAGCKVPIVQSDLYQISPLTIRVSS